MALVYSMYYHDTSCARKLTLREKKVRSQNQNDFALVADKRFRCATMAALVATTITAIIDTTTTCTTTITVTDYSATTVTDHRRHHCRTKRTITAMTTATPAIGLPAVVHYRRRKVRILSFSGSVRNYCYFWF